MAKIEFDPDTCLDINDLRELAKMKPSPTCMQLYTSEGQALSLEGWFKGKTSFFICGGPSLLKMDLDQLHRRGITTFGVNNSWVAFRPRLWMCVDRPGNFVDVGWKDPGIIKFAPLGKQNDPLHIKDKDGVWQLSSFVLKQMPSVFYYRRNEKFQSKTFFTEDTVNWGNHAKVKDECGIKGSRSVMLAALRMQVYLGFTTINIIGADFAMVKSHEKRPAMNYAWKQWRHDSSVNGNNKTYDGLNKRFRTLLPHLEKRGVEVYNCTVGGGLDAFPRKDFQEAVDEAAKECEKPVDTEGYYNHGLKGKQK